MLWEIILLIVGIALLTKGADWLVDGSSDLAAFFKIPPIYVGLTVVAFGTSLPELIVSLFAVFTDKPGISIGNIIGSNIANIGLIIGITALAYPLIVKKKTLKQEFPIMLGISGLLVLLMAKSVFLYPSPFLGKTDGLLLIMIFFIFLYFILKSIKKGKDPLDAAKQVKAKNKNPIWKDIVLISIGSIALFAGGNFFVDSASEIARIFGVSEIVIGLTIVSVGTSLPELFTSFVAALKKQADLAVGNIVGSNIFNIGWVLGVIPLLKNLAINDLRVIYIDSIIMVFFSLALFFFAWKWKKITRTHGVLLFGFYIVYIVYLVLRV